MTPAQYVEKIPIYTAVQWDGTDEARDAIVAAYAGQAHAQDDQIVLTGPVHDDVIERDVWVLWGDSFSPAQVTDATFQTKYQAV
jgi:hypothetical protein